MGFLFEAGLIIEDEFREGNIPAGAGMVDFIKKCLEAMPVSKTITYLRGDSALYQAGVINLCFERGSLFTMLHSFNYRFFSVEQGGNFFFIFQSLILGWTLVSSFLVSVHSIGVIAPSSFMNSGQAINPLPRRGERNFTSLTDTVPVS
jgi:hypothetical protein